jgi:hypothetical protein
VTDACRLGGGLVRLQVRSIRAVHHSLPCSRKGGAVLTHAALRRDDDVAATCSVRTIVEQFREADGEGT